MRNYILAVVAVVAAWAQMWAGTKVSVNANWTFFDGREPDTAVRVDLPHTWNAADADDDTDGYYRGTGHYVKSLTLPETIAGKCVFLEFEGANQTTSLRVNGHEAGEHLGGYSAFVFDITPYVHPGQNEIEVTVDNSHNPDIAPLSVRLYLFRRHLPRRVSRNRGAGAFSRGRTTPRRACMWLRPRWPTARGGPLSMCLSTILATRLRR